MSSAQPLLPPPSEVGIILGVLLQVTLSCTLGAIIILLSLMSVHLSGGSGKIVCISLHHYNSSGRLIVSNQEIVSLLCIFVDSIIIA